MRLLLILIVFRFISIPQQIEAQETAWENENVISSVNWNESRNLIALASRHFGIEILHLDTDTLVTISVEDTGEVADAEFSPDGTLLASVSADGPLRLWNTNSGELVSSLGTSHMAARELRWSPDGKLVAVSAVPESQVWDINSQRVLITIPSGEEPPRLAFDFLGQLYISSAQQIRVWSLLDRQESQRLRAPGLRYAIEISSDSQRILTAHVSHSGENQSYSIRVLDAHDGRALQVFDGFPDIVTSVQWNFDESRILSTGADGSVWITEISTGARDLVLQSDELIISAGWSPYEGQVVVGTALYSEVHLSERTVRSQITASSRMTVVIPDPSSVRLKEVVDACNAPETVKVIVPSTPESRLLSEFVAQVRALPASTIPAACAADLIAVAEALLQE